MTKQQYIGLSIEQRRAVLTGIVGAVEAASQVNYAWDLLPYWLRRHLAYFA